MNTRWLSDDVVIDLIEVPAASSSDATVPASYKDVSEFERFAFLRGIGVSDDTSVTMQVKQATSAGGAGSKDVTGAVSTSATAVGSGANSKWAIIEVETVKLDSANGFRYVAVNKLSSGGAATASTIWFFGWRANTMPVTQPASKGEIVTLGG